LALAFATAAAWLPPLFRSSFLLAVPFSVVGSRVLWCLPLQPLRCRCRRLLSLPPSFLRKVITHHRLFQLLRLVFFRRILPHLTHRFTFLLLLPLLFVQYSFLFCKIGSILWLQLLVFLLFTEQELLLHTFAFFLKGSCLASAAAAPFSSQGRAIFSWCSRWLF
jgi:hypothetical protein